MVVVRCGGCGRVIVDTDKDICDVRLVEDIDLSYKYGRTVMEITEYLTCVHCGRTWAFRDFTDGLKSMYTKKIAKKKGLSVERATEIAGKAVCKVVDFIYEHCER